MNQSALYDDDILEWSEQQADALRHVARTQPGISNEIDWDNIAEEIESVGRSELATVQSLIRKILIHLVKSISVPDRQLLLTWRKEASAFRDDMLDRISPSMPRRIDVDALWQRAKKQAAADLAVYGQDVASSLPEHSPLQIQDILRNDFDFIATAETLRKQFAINSTPSS